MRVLREELALRASEEQRLAQERHQSEIQSSKHQYKQMASRMHKMQQDYLDHVTQLETSLRQAQANEKYLELQIEKLTAVPRASSETQRQLTTSAKRVSRQIREDSLVVLSRNSAS